MPKWHLDPIRKIFWSCSRLLNSMFVVVVNGTFTIFLLQLSSSMQSFACNFLLWAQWKWSISLSYHVLALNKLFMNNIVDIEIKRNIIWHRYRIYRNWHPCCWRFQQLCCLCKWCCINRASNDLEGKKEKPENDLKMFWRKIWIKTSLLDIETSKM